MDVTFGALIEAELGYAANDGERPKSAKRLRPQNGCSFLWRVIGEEPTAK